MKFDTKQSEHQTYLNKLSRGAEEGPGFPFSKVDLHVAREYAKRAYKEFGNMLRAVVLFGSTAHPDYGSHKKKAGDIDVLVVLDDLKIQLTQEMLEAYRIISHKIVAQINKRLHITTLKFTTFWDLMRVGDPVGINILREGLPLIDTGFFEPMQILLMQGKMKPSPEAIHTYFARAPKALQGAKFHILQGVVDMYWGVIDATQAALMKAGIDPPSPKDAGKLVREHLIKPKLLDKRFNNTVEVFYSLAKKILHRETKEIDGKDYGLYLKEADDYIESIRKFLKRGDKK